MFRLLWQEEIPGIGLIDRITGIVNAFTASLLVLFSSVFILIGLLGTSITAIFISWRMYGKIRNEGMTIGQAAGTMINYWILLIFFLMVLATPIAILQITGELQKLVISIFSYLL